MNGGSLQHFAIWLPPALALAVFLGWASLKVEPYFAPWLIFPALVGATLGAGLVWLAHLCKLSGSRWLLIGTLVAAMLTVGTQHALAYRQAIEQFRQREEALLAKAPLAGATALALAGDRLPESFWQFLQQQAEHGRVLLAGWRATGLACWLSWMLDAMLVVAAALGLVIRWRPLPERDRADSVPPTTTP